MKNFGHKPPFSPSIVFAGVTAIVGVLAIAGCSKSNTTATQTAVPLPQNAAQGQTNQVPAPNGQPDLAALNRDLIRWIVGNRRMPTNFQDFAATAGVTIPPPPPGQKYIIGSNMHVQLVNQ